MIPDCGLVPEFDSRRIVVGAKQLKKAILGGRARYVCLAKDADSAITGSLEELCKANGIPYSYVRSMAELGRTCRIEVGAAAAAAVD